jgi:agmatine/peptidylarginine deiminase
MTAKRLPAEWERQSGIILSWPHAQSDWAGQLAEAEQIYLDLAREISLRETLLVTCFDQPHRQHVAQILQSGEAAMNNVRFAIAPGDDTWSRDYGPIGIVENNRPVLLNFTFNGWGGKHPAEQDNLITRHLQAQQIFATTVRNIDFVLEGGSIETDGYGTLLTTTKCLLSPTRNPGLNPTQIETRLRTYLGIQRILWLKHGHLAGDDTDGHIDTLARFCDPQTIAYVSCDDPQDEHHAPLQIMAVELADLRTTDNQPYRLMPLPLPAAIHDAQGRRLPATYANFLIINGAVLVPTYAVPQDVSALTVLQNTFPERAIIGIDCRALIQQFGSLHCITMQLPQGILD